jgi:nitroimidazol reductase NimA-like FMN-containing flavoprotein (pyridoxamine 5'-phosphate oxidase superfamily)
MWIRELSALECSKVLSENRMGHLACSDSGRPYVVPIYYAHSDNHLYAFSMPGRKIDIMRSNALVALQVQARDGEREWHSVIAEGQYEELPDRLGFKRQRDHAWSLLSRHVDWWEPGGYKPEIPVPDDVHHVFFRIGIESVSGRAATAD